MAQSEFDQLFAMSVQPGHYGQFGSVITYTPKDGSPTTLTAIVGSERREQRQVGEKIKVYRVRDIRITKDPTGEFGGIAVPLTNATVTIDTEEWAIDSLSGGIANEWMLTVIRDGVLSAGNTNYRGAKA